MATWKEYRLAEVCNKIGSGATPRGGGDTYLEFGDFALIRSQNILDFQFSYQGLAYISKEQAEKLNNVILEERDILLNITGDSVARVCQAPNEILPARVNQHVAIIRPDKELLNPEFLKYYLLNPLFKDYMLMLSSSGATRNAITKGMIENFIISAPDLTTQNAIAEFLSSLDDKIEHNNQINQNLEALAQALFKQWFIDFEFPNENGLPFKSSGGEMVESELGAIPKNWMIGILDDLVTIKGGTTPSTTEPTYWDGDIYWTSPKDLSNLKCPVLLTTEKRITKEGLKKIGSGLLPKGTLLLSSRAPIGYLAITEIETAINQGYIAINSKNGCSNQYMLYWLKQNMDFIISHANGSTFLEISKSKFKQIKVVIPSEEIHNSFYEQASVIFEQLIVNQRESQNLIQLRDFLLPKLISGELKISEVPILEPV